MGKLFTVGAVPHIPPLGWFQGSWWGEVLGIFPSSTGKAESTVPSSPSQVATPSSHSLPGVRSTPDSPCMGGGCLFAPARAVMPMTRTSGNTWEQSLGTSCYSKSFTWMNSAMPHKPVKSLPLLTPLRDEDTREAEDSLRHDRARESECLFSSADVTPSEPFICNGR